jgi:5-methylcytosine-specific restriction endonuclease McrA
MFEISYANMPEVLSLNRHWQAIGWRTVKQAFCDMNGGLWGNDPAKLAMDLEFEVGPDGELDYLHPVRSIPTKWVDWLKLPIRPYDHWIQTAHQRVRVPKILICPHYDRMPEIKPKCTPQGVYERDQGLDQYATDGRKLQPGEWNLDHVVPRHKGGPSTWENLVVTRKVTNTYKDNRLPHEAGLKLRRAPKAPPAVPVIVKIRHPRHPQQMAFVLR